MIEFEVEWAICTEITWRVIFVYCSEDTTRLFPWQFTQHEPAQQPVLCGVYAPLYWISCCSSWRPRHSNFSCISLRLTWKWSFLSSDSCPVKFGAFNVKGYCGQCLQRVLGVQPARQSNTASPISSTLTPYPNIGHIEANGPKERGGEQSDLKGRPCGMDR